MDRQSCLASAFRHLKEAAEILLESQTPGAGIPSREVLQRAARATAEAHLQLEHLLNPPDPYADQAMRPGLNFHQAAGDDHV